MHHTENATTRRVGQAIATVICDTKSGDSPRITTLELVYPRFIHSEFMTHRMFSRNAASSRATPVQRMIGLMRWRRTRLCPKCGAAMSPAWREASLCRRRSRPKLGASGCGRASRR